jgi:hypothetical protein
MMHTVLLNSLPVPTTTMAAYNSMQQLSLAWGAEGACLPARFSAAHRLLCMPSICAVCNQMAELQASIPTAGAMRHLLAQGVRGPSCGVQGPS